MPFLATKLTTALQLFIQLGLFIKFALRHTNSYSSGNVPHEGDSIILCVLYGKPNSRLRPLSRVYTSATCCAATSCADEQHVAGNKQLVARNMLRWCKRGSFAFTPAQLVARQQHFEQHVACCAQHFVAGNKQLVALLRATCCAGVNAALRHAMFKSSILECDKSHKQLP